MTGLGEETQFCPTQGRRYTPAGRLLIGALLLAELVSKFLLRLFIDTESLSIFSRHTVRISEQLRRPIDIQVRAETLGETLDNIDRDVV